MILGISILGTIGGLIGAFVSIMLGSSLITAFAVYLVGSVALALILTSYFLVKSYICKATGQSQMQPEVSVAS